MNSASVQRACPVCEEARSEVWLTKQDLTLVRCPRCSMVYVSPVPQEMASGTYYDDAGADYYLSPAKLESDYADVRFERELRLFRAHCARGSVLDVGCCTGAFLWQLQKRFDQEYTLHGTDVSGAPLDYAETKGITVFRGNFLEQDWEGRQFDAVTFWAVLEHLAEPKAFLEVANRILRPSGVCFVLVPNLDSLARRLLGARYRYIYPQHLNYFTRHTLTELVRSWFEVRAHAFTHFNPLVIWRDWRSGGKAVPNAERAALLQQTTRWKESRKMALARAAYRLAEAALAQVGLADNVVLVLRKKSNT